jgi:uncharacterized membrane protein (UPF0136 family)
MAAILNALFGNWKTTLLGAAAAVATYLQGQGSTWSVVAAAILFLLGTFAKDSTTGSQALPPKAP